MLNVKKLMTKILELFCAPDLQADFAWSSPWTATHSGILVMRIARTTNSGSVTFYIKDATAGKYGTGAIATGSIPQGFQNTMSFPVVKGHVYETEYTAGVGDVVCRLYKVPSWGGIS